MRFKKFKAITIPKILYMIEPKSTATSNSFSTNPTKYQIIGEKLLEDKFYNVEFFTCSTPSLSAVLDLCSPFVITTDAFNCEKQALIGNKQTAITGQTIVGTYDWPSYRNLSANSSPMGVIHNYSSSPITIHGSTLRNLFNLYINLSNNTTFTGSSYRFSCTSFKFYETNPSNFPLYRQMRVQNKGCSFNLILNSLNYLSRTSTGNIFYQVDWGLLRSRMPPCRKWTMEFSLNGENSSPGLANNIMIYCPEIANMMMNQSPTTGPNRTPSSGCIGLWVDAGSLTNAMDCWAPLYPRLMISSSRCSRCVFFLLSAIINRRECIPLFIYYWR